MLAETSLVVGVVVHGGDGRVPTTRYVVVTWEWLGGGDVLHDVGVHLVLQPTAVQ